MARLCFEFSWDTNFFLENLVVLRLSESSITDGWFGWGQFKTARNLKVQELEDLKLTSTSDLSSFLSLKRLTVRQCESLVHIDPSIGNLEFLNSLIMDNSFEFPFIMDTPYPNRQEVLHLPSSICNIKALSRLIIHGFKMKQLPINIGELKGLKAMVITGCEFLRNLPDCIGDLKSLCKLVLSDDEISELPESIDKLRNLTKLNVSHNRLRRPPATIGDLVRLEMLDASDNRDLLCKKKFPVSSAMYSP